MSGLESLYQELILENAKLRHGYGLKEGGVAESHQLNPICGDEITLRLHLDSEHTHAEAISWEGKGCSISQASASLLAQIVPGLSRTELMERVGLFREALRSKGRIEIDEELFGDAVALSGVSKYIARVKCAMLPWVALEDTLAKAGQEG